MTSSTLPRPIVCIAPEGDHERLEGSLPGSSESWTIVKPQETERTIERTDPALIVVSTSDPGSVGPLVERVRSARTAAPIVLSPLSGSERLATAAVRVGVADYVPCSRADALADRLVTLADADERGPETGGEGRSRSPPLLSDSLPVEAFVIDDSGRFDEVHLSPEASERYAVDPEKIVDATIDDVFSAETAPKLLDCVLTAIETESVQTIEYDAETPGGRYCFEARVYPLEDSVDGRRSVVWLAREITERVRRERSLRRQRDQLETLNRINGLLQRVIHTLVDAPTRAEIERDVCQQLVASDLYCGAWIGERTGDDEICHRTAAGHANRYIEALSKPSIIDNCPVVADVLESGECRTTNHILDTDGVPEPILQAAEADDVSSAIAVPIRYDETIYGVLTVLAHREDAFSEREQAAFGSLGEIIGFAINAVMNRRLLFADSILELELAIEDGDSLSFELSEKYDCSAHLEWAGTTANGRLYQYVTIDGLDGDTVMSAAREHDSIASCRLIQDGNDRCTIEMRLKESGVGVLRNYGASVGEVVVEDGVATVSLDVPRSVDIRQLLDSFRSVYPESRLVAKREVERDVTTAADRRDRIFDALTDRQLTALRLAFYGGYFDWPRGTTGEEIADAMEVAPPTMHQHLRSALRQLLTEFFEQADRLEDGH